MAKKPKMGEFPKLKQARERLRDRADEIIDMLLETAAEAKQAQDFETAASTLKWLIEHMPAAEDGTRVVDNSVDKQPKQDKFSGAPRIQIGVAVGQGKQLPPHVEVIDVEPE